ncbi:hypothetical protein [Brevundimonas sp.]|uniref:hypothetical protein n=1 Tax=Brevundimonas sp. TaxID=1871086 RepID=UPI0028A8B4F6|nr:hypothetical protein [Brevundimonas sp.]
MSKPTNYVRPLSQTLGSIRELTKQETDAVSGGGGGTGHVVRGDSECWDNQGMYKKIDD